MTTNRAEIAGTPGPGTTVEAPEVVAKPVAGRPAAMAVAGAVPDARLNVAPPQLGASAHALSLGPPDPFMLAATSGRHTRSN